MFALFLMCYIHTLTNKFSNRSQKKMNFVLLKSHEAAMCTVYMRRCVSCPHTNTQNVQTFITAIQTNKSPLLLERNKTEREVRQPIRKSNRENENLKSDAFTCPTYQHEFFISLVPLYYLRVFSHLLNKSPHISSIRLGVEKMLL